MYVYISSFKIKDGDETTFIEMQKFEENQDAKPAGLDHFHIFKDLKKPGNYWLLEYWNSKEDKDKLDASEVYKYFEQLRDPLLEEKAQDFECQMII